jgi:hypothetical protein
MSSFYKNYIWKNGIPYGVEKLSQDSPPTEECYKIAMDPYRKRISVERYTHRQFAAVIYDSAFLDFRHLKPQEQTAWHKEIIEESSGQVVSLIRNQDDRVICREVCLFEEGLCRECRLYSPQGFHLSTHKMLYTTLKDPFNGVILYDPAERIVMQKRYAVEEGMNEFRELLEENWELTTVN